MSANVLRLALCSMLLVLGACSNGELPKWLTGEPTQAEIDAYKGPVPMPPAPPKDAPYPNLADVPPRPVPKLNTIDRQNEIKRLEQENTVGQAAVTQFTAESAPAAPVVKAKPVTEPAKKKPKKKKPAAPKPAELFAPEPGQTP